MSALTKRLSNSVGFGCLGKRIPLGRGMNSLSGQKLQRTGIEHSTLLCQSQRRVMVMYSIPLGRIALEILMSGIRFTDLRQDPQDPLSQVLAVSAFLELVEVAAVAVPAVVVLPPPPVALLIAASESLSSPWAISCC